MDEILIEKLEWDSYFFGYPIGRISFLNNCEPDKELLHDALLSGGFRLIYLFANPLSEKVNGAIISTGAHLVDRKIIFSKNTENHQRFANTIIEYSETEVTKGMQELALSTGTYSRFKKDPGFVDHEFERLYTEWILKSVRKEIARKVFISTFDSKITGLITYGDKNESATIGLLSVDKQFRGKKIGWDLVHMADSDAFTLGYKTIEVATQFQNKAAYQLYLKCNFHIAEEINVYHFWNSK